MLCNAVLNGPASVKTGFDRLVASFSPNSFELYIACDLPIKSVEVRRKLARDNCLRFFFFFGKICSYELS